MPISTLCGFTDGPSGKGRDFLVLMGPTIAVDVGFDPSYGPGAQQPPIAGMKGLMALVDTGATESSIDNLLAAQLGLPLVNRRPVSGAHGKRDVNVYMAQVHVPALSFTIYGEFTGADLIAGGQLHYALIGRTFLSSFQMVYDGLTGTR